jgi:hypothetical protein
VTTEAADTRLPLVAVISGVPLLSEAVEEALDGIAEVRSFPAGGGDTVEFLRFLRPDAVVVDNAEEARAAVRFAREENVTLVHVSLPDQRLRLLRTGGWVEYTSGLASPERLRSALAAGLMRKGARS